MRTLLHICCAPCTIYPLKVLRAMGNDVFGVYYNPNIHPYTEYTKRRDTVEEYAADVDLRLIGADEYPMEEFIRNVAFREDNRCSYCYYTRLDYAAHIAKKGKFDTFTTTLLYSKFQKHDMIISIAEGIAKKYGIRFLYHDFREGWKEGIEISKQRGMYRQQYCGCIYSEKERFYPGNRPR